MRIISGIYKGRNISPPKNNIKARPTTDFAKENVFNIINNYFHFNEINVLDLFAGTGSISYEFASRGSKKVYSVENYFNHYNFIIKTVKNLNFKQISIFKADVFKFINNIDEQFDIIFADPPYGLDKTLILPELIFENKIVKDEGWFILEHDKRKNFNNSPYLFDVRIYGSVYFSFFKIWMIFNFIYT